MFIVRPLENSMCSKVGAKSLLCVTTFPLAGYTFDPFQSILHPVLKGLALTAEARFSKGKKFCCRA